jgi:hypothetical protein
MAFLEDRLLYHHEERYYVYGRQRSVTVFKRVLALDIILKQTKRTGSASDIL